MAVSHLVLLHQPPVTAHRHLTPQTVAVMADQAVVAVAMQVWEALLAGRPDRSL